MLLLVVLQVCLSCLLCGAEKATEVVVAAGYCVAFSLETTPVWLHTLEACLPLVRPDEKVLLHLEMRRSETRRAQLQHPRGGSPGVPAALPEAASGGAGE